MAFRLTQKPTFVANVKVEMANSKGGFDSSTFKATFKRLGTVALDDLRRQAADEQIRQVLVGYTDLLDDDDQQVPFSDEGIAALIDIPQARLALHNTFWNANFRELAEKN